MLGLFERIGEGLEMVGIAIEGAFLEAECAVKNAITDIKTDAKVRKYQKVQLEAGDTLDDEEVKEGMEAENYINNRFRKNAFLYGRGGLGKGIRMIIECSEK